MHPISYQAVQMIAKQKLKEDMRRAENIRLARIARRQRKDGILTRLKALVKYGWLRVTKRTNIALSDEKRMTAELCHLSPEQLRYQETKRLFYERIMTGNALAESEYLVNKIGEGR